MNAARVRTSQLLGTLLLVLLGVSWHPTSPLVGSFRSVNPAASTVATVAGPAAAVPELGFDFPRAELPQAPGVASLAIPGRNGYYLVPYIQSQADLHFRVRVHHAPADSVVEVLLDPGTRDTRVAPARPPTYDGDFANVGLGDHRLVAQVYARHPRQYQPGDRGRGPRLASAQLTHVARGDIVAAIGDSTTEGNGGAYFPFFPNWISALANAADWTSPDGRNFPQAGAFARPEAPASFTSTLGTILERQRHHPVLVLNDGWSGATTQSYREISFSRDLAAEYTAAAPTSWIINLGVNDPLIHASAADFAANMRALLQNLTSRYGARNGDIHVACPTYARDKRHDGEAVYLPLIDQLRSEAGLGAAPNFFSYFRDNPSGLADEVHPNAPGYRAMAALWAQALQGQGGSCS